ncbi:anti-sigma regulatory factor (Ser/Thr protein kinase) [Kitasatospora sp. MAA4]|uniref:ATP-binding protein n=1 Tax=Kitasatospora sp. MAA4 TaxID=3035093 RepID=UPI00247467AD|nr:ATP-binding protein [Kitasatospora sp. MAA4]MDH6137588.1 anti-sigma regulatory factor (Ser/Thr protein kinase) [Kitasatospora sp. MAA4]
MTAIPAQPAPVSAAPVVEQHDEYSLPHHATAPSKARHHARQVLADWGLAEELVFDALLVVSELVTNAVEHALPPTTLRLQAHATDGRTELQVDVMDGGPAAHDGEWTSSCAADEHGRGRQIVAALANGTVSEEGAGGGDHGATLRTAEAARAAGPVGEGSFG